MADYEGPLQVGLFVLDSRGERLTNHGIALSVLLTSNLFLLQKFPELKFKYVEEEQPEEFFIPYVWSLVYKSAKLYWNPERIQLFHPGP